VDLVLDHEALASTGARASDDGGVTIADE